MARPHCLRDFDPLENRKRDGASCSTVSKGTAAAIAAEREPILSGLIIDYTAVLDFIQKKRSNLRRIIISRCQHQTHVFRVQWWLSPKGYVHPKNSGCDFILKSVLCRGN